jgi:hypothetical protein
MCELKMLIKLAKILQTTFYPINIAVNTAHLKLFSCLRNYDLHVYHRGEKISVPTKTDILDFIHLNHSY